MLLKDDLFEVVFDPGADKRENGVLSPITLLDLFRSGDTGRARLMYLGTRSKIGAAG